MLCDRLTGLVGLVDLSVLAPGSGWIVQETRQDDGASGLRLALPLLMAGLSLMASLANWGESK